MNEQTMQIASLPQQTQYRGWCKSIALNYALNPDTER